MYIELSSKLELIGSLLIGLILLGLFKVVYSELTIQIINKRIFSRLARGVLKMSFIFTFYFMLLISTLVITDYIYFSVLVCV